LSYPRIYELTTLMNTKMVGYHTHYLFWEEDSNKYKSMPIQKKKKKTRKKIEHIFIWRYRTKFLSSVLLYMQGAICPPKSRNNIRTIVVQHGQVLHKSLCDRRFWIYWFLARHEAAGERLYCPCNIEKFGSVFPLSFLLFLCVNIDVLHVLFVSQGTNPK
jgi:hypothetical protein